MKTFKHPDPRTSLGPIITHDYSWPTWGIRQCAKGWVKGGQRADHI